MIAYASRTLTKSESNYSVIQKECLAVIFGMKQFRHHSFTMMTDHAPLQWFSAQKMQSLLSRWAQAIQEYTFDIVYRKGTDNTNADSLSRNPVSHSSLPIYKVLSRSMMHCPILRIPTVYGHSLFSSGTYRCGINCLLLMVWYVTHTSQGHLTVPLLPASLHKSAMYQSHDIPTSGHQGIAKTLQRLQEVAYWVGMAKAVSQYCAQCVTCQQAKLPAPTPAPLTNVPIGGPWQKLAADILEVPVSH